MHYRKMKRNPLSLICICTLGAVASSSVASTWSGVSTADAFVTTGPTDNLMGNNYGGAGALMLSADLSQGAFESVLKFDLADALTQFDTDYGEGQWSVSSVTLQLGTNFGTAGQQPNNPIFNEITAGSFGVDWMSDDSWAEGTGNPSVPTTDGITFDTLPGYLSAEDLSLGAFDWVATGNGVSTYDLVFGGAFLDDILDGSVASFRLYANDAEVSYLINSRSFGQATNRPALTITAVPEPAAWLWLALPACALAWLSRLRRRA